MSDKTKHFIAGWTFFLGIIAFIFGTLCLAGYALSKAFPMKADFYIEFTVAGLLLTFLGSYLMNKLDNDKPGAENKKKEPVKEVKDEIKEEPVQEETKKEVQAQESPAEDAIESVELPDALPDNFVYSDKDNSIRSKMSDILGDWSKWQDYDNDPIKVRNTCKNLKEYAENLLENDEIYLNNKSDIDYNQFSACLKALWGSINGAMYNLSLFVKNDGNRLILPSEDEVRLISSMCDVILSYTETVYGIR
ncbi:MAG: hypothetical protein IKF80_07740 [Erysipelotrichaceae bacterium]|nr:hypothetical protein [Erysipelotrichaceae bacterium]